VALVGAQALTAVLPTLTAAFAAACFVGKALGLAA
jgi:hypothetical protein